MTKVHRLSGALVQRDCSRMNYPSDMCGQLCIQRSRSRGSMKNLFLAMMVMALTSAGWAAALGTSTRSAIPGDAQQIISVDYRALRNNSTAHALSHQVLPENQKAFEPSSRDVGTNPENQLD